MKIPKRSLIKQLDVSSTKSFRSDVSLFLSFTLSVLCLRRAFNIIGELRRIFSTLDIPPRESLLRNNTGKCVPHTVSQEYFINERGRRRGQTKDRGTSGLVVRASVLCIQSSRFYSTAERRGPSRPLAETRAFCSRSRPDRMDNGYLSALLRTRRAPFLAAEFASPPLLPRG